MVISVVGPSGSGKGTQSKLLSKHLGIETISTGDLLRKEIAENTEIGLKVQEYVKKGEWPPDSLVVQPLYSKLQSIDISKGFILDGFPRTGSQVGILDSLLAEFNLNLEAVIHFYLPSEEILARMRKQRGEGEQRPDMDDEVISQRLKSYVDTIYPVAQQYLHRGILISVDGRPSIDEIFQDILNQLSSLPSNRLE
jgi:adenylate kinase